MSSPDEYIQKLKYMNVKQQREIIHVKKFYENQWNHDKVLKEQDQRARRDRSEKRKILAKARIQKLKETKLLHEKETDEDQMKRMRSCIETLRSRSQSSLKRYALERMLWELRKRIARRLFSSSTTTTTCPVRLFSAYVSVSSVEDTADLTINCLRYLHFSNETRARICRKAVKILKSLRLSGLIIRVVLCVLDPYADSETERSNVVVKDEELVSVLRKYISSSNDVMSLEEFVWRKRCCYNFSSTNNENDDDHDTIVAALQIMALSKGFFWAYAVFEREVREF